MQWRQRNVQKRVMHVPSYCFANLNLFLFLQSRQRRRRRILSSFLLETTGKIGTISTIIIKETRLNPNTKPNLTLTLT